MRLQTRGIGQVTSGAATIAATIQQMEGYYPGSVAYQNNNPGNLMYAGQSGATKGTNGFAVFPTYQDGYNALLNQLNIYANQGLTINQMMAKYAPAYDNNGNPIPGNNPTLYASTIAGSLGVSPNTTVADALAGTGGTGGTDTVTTDSTLASDTTDSIDPTTLAVAGALTLAVIYLMG